MRAKVMEIFPSGKIIWGRSLLGAPPHPERLRLKIKFLTETWF